MTMDAKSLDWTVYSALKHDLTNKQHVDMVLAYYNEATSKVEFSKECHKIALAAKSRSLHQILLRHADHEGADTALIFVGQDNGSEVEALFNKCYNPETSSEEITLWSNEALTKFECTPDINFENDILDEDIKKEDLDDPLCEWEMGDKFEECDLKNTTEHTGEPSEYGKIMTVYRKDVSLNMQKRKQTDHVVVNSGMKPPQAAQQQLRKSCLPKGLPGMDPFFYCTGFSLTQDQKEELESANQKYGLSLFFIENLLAKGCEDIGFYKPDLNCSSEFKRRKLDALLYRESLVPYFSCRNCKNVIESTDMYNHALKCKISSTSPSTRPSTNPPTKTSTSIISQKMHRNEVDIPLMEKLLKEKDPDVAFKRHKAYAISKLGHLQKYLCYVIHKKYHQEKERKWSNGREGGRPSPFLYCRLCYKVIGEEGIGEHDCIKAISSIVTIYGNDQSRVTILDEEHVNPIYLSIHPVRLDNNLTDLCFCERCKSFIPKALILKSDYHHMCFGTDGWSQKGKQKGIWKGGFKSSNLKTFKRKDTSSNARFQCMLCDEKFKSADPAEFHMRNVHGEGEKQVLCSYCGQGFETTFRAQRHEMKQHGRKEGPSQKELQCTECGKKFRLLARLNEHMLRLHSSARPCICEQCGKAFKTERDLKHHIKTHGENTVQCDLCELKFRNKANLRQHRMRHTGERPNVCPYCHHGFIQLGDCKSHIRKIHGIIVPKGMSMKTFCDSLSTNPDQYGQPKI